MFISLGAAPLPSILFNPHHGHHHMNRPPFYRHELSLPPVAPSSNKASLFHILSQPEPESVNMSAVPHMSVHNHHHMRKLFFEEGLLESDELGLEHPKKKVKRDNKPKSPMKGIIVNNDDVQERETVAAGLCFKTHKPKVQREYYYAKLSKTIFRWTCCGSQAKTHPDA